MTLAQLLLILRARWCAALLTFVFVIAAVLAVTLLAKKQYTATASVVLDVRSPDPIAGIVLPGMAASSYTTTQIGILQSERVALRVVSALGLAEKEHWRSSWREASDGQGSIESWIAQALLKKLEVTGRESNVLMVEFTSPDPEAATRVVNAFVQSYIDTTVELRVEPAKQYGSFFDARAKALRDDLERSQNRLSDYQRSKGIIATDERLDVENARLSELSTQLITLQALVDQSGSRRAQADSSPERMQEVLTNRLITDLTTDLSRQQTTLDELEDRLGERHPRVREQKTSIAQLRARINSETRRIGASIRVDDDVNRSRLTQTRQALEAQRNKVLQMKGQRDEAAVLLRDVENAQRAYEQIVQRSNNALLESQVSQTNVSRLKDATLPTQPSSPRTVLNLAVAIIVGGMLAVAVAILREVRDKRLRLDADVVEILRAPLIGVLPNRPSTKKLSSGIARMRLLDAPRPSQATS